MASSIIFQVILLFTLYTSARTEDNFYYGTCSTQFEPNPTDCTTYFQCNFGIRVLRQCPTSLHWNRKLMACDWPSNARCVETEPVESLPEIEDHNELEFDNKPDPAPPLESCSEGLYLPNPADCNSYHICNHGNLLIQYCSPGLNWNDEKFLCDWPANSQCGSGQSSKPPIALPPPPAKPPVASPSVPPAEPPVASPSVPPAEPPVASPSVPPAEPPVASPSVPPVKPPVASPPFPPAKPPVEQPPVVQPPPPAQPVVTTPWTSGLKLVCYFTDWSWYRPLPSGKFLPEHIDPSLCTHIVYAFALLNGNDFILQPADTWADFDNFFYQKVTSLKSTGTKVTLALGGWNDSGGSKYSQLVNDPGNRAKFVASVVDYLQKYNFDGLDLDWEYPSCWQGNCKQGLGDKQGFASLVKELRAALPPDAILSAAVSASKLIIDQAYDVPTLSAYLDWIGVMDYDFHGNWDKQTGHIAPLYFMTGDGVPFYNVNSSIAHWLECGAAKEKLIMGIPLYGQTFTLASSTNHGLNAPSYGPGEAGEFTRQGGVLSYYEICSKQWNIVQDSQGRMGPYGHNGNQWVSFDDVGMVTIKANYAKSLGLGGGMIWALDMDDFTNKCGQGKYPLLTAIANTLKT